MPWHLSAEPRRTGEPAELAMSTVQTGFGSITCCAPAKDTCEDNPAASRDVRPSTRPLDKPFIALIRFLLFLNLRMSRSLLILGIEPERA
jgi:hypothetical protein